MYRYKGIFKVMQDVYHKQYEPAAKGARLPPTETGQVPGGLSFPITETVAPSRPGAEVGGRGGPKVGAE